MVILDQEIVDRVRRALQQSVGRDAEMRVRSCLVDAGERDRAQDACARSFQLRVDDQFLGANCPIQRSEWPCAEPGVEAEYRGRVALVEVDDRRPRLHPAPAIDEERVAAAVKHVLSPLRQQRVAAWPALKERIRRGGGDRHGVRSLPDILRLQIADRAGVDRAPVVADGVADHVRVRDLRRAAGRSVGLGTHHGAQVSPGVNVRDGPGGPVGGCGAGSRLCPAAPSLWL